MSGVKSSEDKMPVVESVWVSQIEPDFDLEEFASGVLSNAIQNLKDDGYLEAAAFLVTSTELHCLSISFDGYEQKEKAYTEVIRRARELKARAIVTLNDTYIGKDKYDPETYEWGAAAKDPGGEAIMVTVSGPGRKTLNKQVQYFRSPKGLLFGAVIDECGTFLGMLHGWATPDGGEVN